MLCANFLLINISLSQKKKKTLQRNSHSHITITILLIFYGTHKDPGPVVGPFKRSKIFFIFPNIS